MDLLTKDLLINLLFIIAALFLVQFWYDKTKKKPSKRFTTAVASVSIILCMTFSQPLENDSLLTLQKIPFILATLYCGWRTSLILLILMTLFRPIVHLEGTIEMVIVYTISFFLLIPFVEKFKQMNSSKRVLFTSLVSLSMPIIPGIFMFVIPLHKPPGFTMNEQVIYLLIPTIGIAIVTYLAEKIRENIYLQEKIIKAERLEAISHLAASISHEVRNPLTAAKGFMELIEQYELSREKQQEYLKIGIEELNQAERIIKDYLTFAKQADEIVLEEIRVEEELKGVMDVLQPLANMNSIIPSLSLVPCIIYGNKTKFRQCLLNLIKNCIEAMPNGGSLSISMTLQFNELLLEIKDTGDGMTKEQISRIGEPYYTSKGMNGTGLGMMVVFSVINSLNGKIDINSKVGKGTTFKVAIPLAKQNI